MKQKAKLLVVVRKRLILREGLSYLLFSAQWRPFVKGIESIAVPFRIKKIKDDGGKK